MTCRLRRRKEYLMPDVSKLIALADRLDAYNESWIAVGFYTEDGEVESLREAIRLLQETEPVK